MIFKILLLVGIGFAAWAMIRSFKRSLDIPPDTPRKASIETMVKCARCGVNLPRSEGLLSNGEIYCSEEHQKLGKS